VFPHFRGVFMRDSLPGMIWQKECGIVNLDSSSGDGTHWIAYWKDGPTAVYFDSYGLDPPLEMESYLAPNASDIIGMQTFQLQGPDDVICGHLCLLVLKKLTEGQEFKDIILSLV